MNPKVLIDTSIWIEYFNKIESDHGQTAERLIRMNSAYLIGPVLYELLQGSRNPNESTLLMESLVSLPFIEIDKSLWVEAGRLSFKLRKKGVTLPMTDCIIATAAKEFKCKIYTLDQHFAHFPELLFDFQ